MSEFYPYTIWRHDNIVQLNFSSMGCRWKYRDSCIVCNYGHHERNVTTLEAEEGIDEVLSTYGKEEGLELVLGACGSFLDEMEIPSGVLYIILQRLAEQDVFQRITFETHYYTISDKILAYLKKQLPGKTLAIEMGLESGNQSVLNECYKKNVRLDGMAATIKRIKEFGFEVELNVMVGAPYLSVQDRDNDAYEAILWAFEHEADHVVLFPVNIKPKTILWDLYQAGEYELVSMSEVNGVLKRLPKNLRSKVSLSWTGDRQKSADVEKYGWDQIIPPKE